MTRLFIQGATLMLALALAGCASFGVIKNATPVATSIPVSIEFALVESSSGLAGLETETHLLNELIISGLRAQEIFGDVEDNPVVISERV